MPDYSKFPAFCITGPTAAGKTDIAVELARKFPVEIISVDSALIYKGMDVGSAKPSTEILKEIPHHLVDICDPAESYSVAKFCEDVHRLIPEVYGRGNIPLLVGGTMMYFNALRNGLSEMPESNPAIRAELERQAAEKGVAYLYKRLQLEDPIGAERLEPADTQRILRALEVVIGTGKPMHEYWADVKWKLPNPIHAFAICPADRAVLHERIALRSNAMLKAGLIPEVERLMCRGDLSINLPSIRAVGYRQVWQYLSGELVKSELQEKITVATRRLAKRQLTWLRPWSGLVWLKPEKAFEALYTALLESKIGL